MQRPSSKAHTTHLQIDRDISQSFGEFLLCTLVLPANYAFDLGFCIGAILSFGARFKVSFTFPHTIMLYLLRSCLDIAVVDSPSVALFMRSQRLYL